MDDVARQLSNPADWALFLDIDGTLLDIAPTPDDVVVPPSLPEVLDALTARTSGALALVSGRDLAGIDRLFPGDRDAAGCHGAEWRQGGNLFAMVEAVPQGLVAAVSAGAGQLPGVRVEAKARSVALHFRDCLEREAEVVGLANAVIREAGPQFQLLEGKSVIEIIPVGATKGEAIDRFMCCPPYAGRRPVFVGDDITDESGFDAVNRAGGLSIHVGEGPGTAARFRFQSPDWLRHWLASLERSMRGISGNEHA